MTDFRLKWPLFGLLTLTTLLISTGFLVGERPLGMVAVLALAVVWAALLWRNGRRAAAWPALLLTLTAALVNAPDAPLDTSPAFVWSFLGVLGALLLWDLSRFRQRLQDATGQNAAQPLIAAHLGRLGLLVALSLTALALQLWLPLAFNFDWALLSGLVLLLGLRALLRRLRA